MKPISALLGVLLVVGRSACEWPVVNCPDTFRSSVIKSGDKQAYSVTEARSEAGWECVNTSRLYISQSRRPFRAVYTLTAHDISDSADSILPIAWSRDGRWLAIEAFYSTHLPTDFASYGVLLYDSRTQKVKDPDINFDAAVSQALNRECEVWLNRVAGFDGAGNVILEFRDNYDEEGKTKSCVGIFSKWLLDPESEELSREPALR